MQFISGVKVVHAADKAERHRYRLLRQDDAKPWSKESAAMPSHHTTKDRSSFRVSGLAVSAVYSPLAFVSSMCMYSAQASQSRADGLALRHQAAGKAHAKAARLAELRDVLRR